MTAFRDIGAKLLGSQSGQETWRTSEGIYKQAVRRDGDDRYEARIAGIHREAMILEHLSGTGIAPSLIDVGDDWSLQQDLGDTDSPIDGETYRRALVRLLHDIGMAGVRHGDLTEGNIIVLDGRAWAVDWQDANVIGDPPLQAHNCPDSNLLWRSIVNRVGPEGLADVPRVARRWRAVLQSLGALDDNPVSLAGQTFVDLGCFQGDFVAAASAEGMSAHGYDKGGFRTGENSIEIARQLFGDCDLVHLNELDIVKAGPALVDGADVVLLFSTWAYFLEDCAFGGPGPLNRAEGVDFVREVATRCGTLFFETQIAGDGPGPPWLRCQSDVGEMFTGMSARVVGSFPVTGRDAERVVWMVTT